MRRGINTRSLGALLDSGVIGAVNGFPFGGHNEEGAGIPHIRPFNVATNGEIRLDQIKWIPMDAATGKPRLQRGDIVFNNTNTKELVGKCALWDQESEPVFSNHMTRIRVLDRSCDPAYLSFAILHHWMIGRSEMLARTHVAQASIMGERFREIEVPWLDPKEQHSIARVLDLIRTAANLHGRVSRLAQELKRATMRELFTRGLRGEPQKETEIGPVPESWEIVPLKAVARARGGTSFPPALQGKTQGDLPFFKVSDMNLAGNEQEMRTSTNWVSHEDLALLRAKPFPKATIIFPKVGGALHTNKKRLLSTEALIDNNIMGVTVEAPSCLPKFLFSWFQTVNLSSIANAGPLPSINSNQLYELRLPIPGLDEQRDIVAILDAIDRKIELHRKKRAVLEELFKALLHKLMTGEIRVADLDLSALGMKNEGVGACR